MSHEDVSRLLTGFVAGNLSGEEDVQVREHLAHCSDCSLELAGAQALAALVPGKLSEHERAQLRRRMAVAIDTPIKEATARSRLGRWLPAMGVAAIAAAVAVGFVVSPSGLDEEAATGTRDEATGADVFDDSAGSAIEAAPDAGTSSKALQLSGPLPPPLFAPAVALSSADIQRAARSSPFVEYALAYTVDDIGRVALKRARQLADRAPNGSIGREIKRCIRVVGETVPYTLIPVYAAVAQVKHERGLVLGFVWTPRPVGPMYKYMMWAWVYPKCGGAPLIYLSDRVPTRSVNAGGATVESSPGE